MNILIDWLSFTIPWLPSTPLDPDYQLKVEHALQQQFDDEIALILTEKQWHMRQGGKQPFGVGWDINSSGISVFTGENVPYILIEFSGKGCEFLRRNNIEHEILDLAGYRATRIDIACDIKTGWMPSEFAPKRAYGKTKSYTEWNSPTGQTVYIGSMKSETYTRVYRYAFPDPRSALLRVEFVLRRALAKRACAEIAKSGVEGVARWAAEKIDLGQGEWSELEIHPVDIAYPRAKKADASSLIWLMKQVAPRFKQLVLDGVIPDAEKFLKDYFLE